MTPPLGFSAIVPKNRPGVLYLRGYFVKTNWCSSCAPPVEVHCIKFCIWPGMFCRLSVTFNGVIVFLLSCAVNLSVWAKIIHFVWVSVEMPKKDISKGKSVIIDFLLTPWLLTPPPPEGCLSSAHPTGEASQPASMNSCPASQRQEERAKMGHPWAKIGRNMGCPKRILDSRLNLSFGQFKEF